MKKFFNLAVLSMTALATLTTPANATVVGSAVNPAGNTIVYTDDMTPPDSGYTYLACGTRPGSDVRVCAWTKAVAQQTAPASGIMTLEQFAASQQTVATPSYQAPVATSAPVTTNVANQPNPLVGKVKPDTQTACQTGDGSFRCVSVQPKPGLIATLLGLAVGAALVMGAVRGNSYYGGGVVSGPFISGGSCGGCGR